MDKRDKKIIERDKMPKKIEIKKQNEILKIFLICIGIVLLILASVVIYSKLITHFEYKEIKFDIQKYGDLIVYHASLPLSITETNKIYVNVYLRNDPRELEKKVPAKGTLLSIEDIAINMSEEFKCGGNGVLAIGELTNLHNALGKKVLLDKNATCDSQGRYILLNIMEGNSTSIQGIGPNCYNLYVNNCEILEGTERFMVGLLFRISRDYPQ